MTNPGQKTHNKPSGNSPVITMFMCGDVMTGRGIDQILPHASDPSINERYMRTVGARRILGLFRRILPDAIVYKRYVKSAREYVELAEMANGLIQQPVGNSYIWGDALEGLERRAPDLRIINLETSITKSNNHWKGEGIHYRMHPENITCIEAAKIDCCSLANNHVVDWGYSGLLETLESLDKIKVKRAGAGKNAGEAASPVVIEVDGKGSKTSGIPLAWAASEDEPGVNLLKDLSDETVLDIKERIQKVKQQGDILAASIHWGRNWDYKIPDKQIEFAHKLIDQAGVDVIHGHSSHHVKGIEVYKGNAIIYGCGDLLNDYEGHINFYKDFRGDLGLMYFVSLNSSTGKLVNLQMTPTKVKRLRVNRASKTDALWLRDTLNRECKRFGTRVELKEHDNALILEWD